MKILHSMQSGGFDSGKGRQGISQKDKWPLYDFEVY